MELSKNKAEEIQENIFRQMTDEKKFAFWAQLWRLGKTLNPNFLNYGRPSRAARQNRQDS